MALKVQYLSRSSLKEYDKSISFDIPKINRLLHSISNAAKKFSTETLNINKGQETQRFPYHRLPTR